MKISPNQINFNGRYIVEGSKEEIDYVHKLVSDKNNINIKNLSTIKIAGSKDGKTTYGEIFATNEDSVTFSNAKKKQEFLPTLKSFKGQLRQRCSQIIEYIFGNIENTRVIDAKSALLEIRRGGYSFMEDGILTSNKNYLLDGTVEKTDIDKKVVSIKTADGIAIKKTFNEDGSYFKLLPENKLQYFGKDNKKVDNITTNNKKISTVTFCDGTKKTYNYKGKLIKETIATQDGDFKNYESGKHVSTRFSDGSEEFYKFGRLTNKILSDGTKQEFKYNCDRSYFIVSSDGNIFYANPKIENSTIAGVSIDKRGNKTVKFKDGSKKIYDEEGNLTNIKTTHDGAIEEYDRKKLIRRTLSDGSVERYYLDKLQYIKHPDGSSQSFKYNRDNTYFVLTYKPKSYDSPDKTYVDEKNKDLEVVNISEDDEQNTTVEFANGEQRTYDSTGLLISETINGITKNYGGLLEQINPQGLKGEKNKKQSYNQDGTSFVMSNGKIKYLNIEQSAIKTKKIYSDPNGIITVIFPNDSIKIYDSKGCSEPYDFSHKSDGVIEEYKNFRLIAKILQDGTIESYKDGSITSKKHNDGTIESYKYNKDGTCFILSDNNNNKYINEKNVNIEVASITVDKDENKTVEFLSGNKKIYNKKGILTHLVNNGFIIAVNLFGGIISKESPNGTIEKYERGELVSRTLQDGTIEKYSHKALTSRVLSDGTIEECYSNGHIHRRTLSDGTIEIYDAYDKLTSKILSDGTIERYITTDNKKTSACSEKTKYDYRYKRYKSAYMSLASTIAWKLSPSTKQIHSDLAKIERCLGAIFAKVEENNKYKDALTFDEPTDEINAKELTDKEQAALNSYHKTSWQISGTSEFSQAGLKAHKAVNDFLLCGIDSIEDEQIKETIEKWIKEFPKKYKALIS